MDWVQIVTVGAAVGMPLLGGLGWVAYNHPEGYARLQMVIMMVALALFAGFLGHDLGVQQGIRMAVESLDNKVESISLFGLYQSRYITYVVCMAVTWAVLWFFANLKAFGIAKSE